MVLEPALVCWEAKHLCQNLLRDTEMPSAIRQVNKTEINPVETGATTVELPPERCENRQVN